ncbi:MAG: LytTR family transcriptional regulator, partial [Eubacterium sp.]|nr:LytTR family transcriptional regulator [Eubacterium sp.]
MKVRIELDEGRTEEEVVIHCRSLTDEVRLIQKAVSSVIASQQNIILYKGDTEYYVAPGDILFFETEGNILNAHTREQVFQTRYRLYELEEILSGNFIRVSKAALVNVQEIYSLSKITLSATSVISFA